MKYSAALALAATLAAARPGHGPIRQHHSGARIAGSTPKYSDNWSGANHVGSGITHVEGTIVIPSYTGGDPKRSISVWIGVDGDGDCPRQGNKHAGIWQTGFDLYANGHIQGWSEWYPKYTTDFHGFDVKAGDKVKMSIDLSSDTAGVATLENLTTGESVSANGTAPDGSPVCRKLADWIVEDYQAGSKKVPIFNFGTLTVTDAHATGDAGAFTADGGQVIDLEPNGADKILTDCEINAGAVSCKYIGDDK